MRTTYIKTDDIMEKKGSVYGMNNV